MRLPDLSTPQPTLVIGEPGCPISRASPPPPAARFSRPRSAHCGPAARDGSAPTSSTACGSACCLVSVMQQSCACGQLDHGAPAIPRKRIMLADELEATLIRRGWPSWLRRGTSACGEAFARRKPLW